MKINMSGSKTGISIDGRNFKGSSVTIVNGKVSIDGVEQEGSLVGDVNIEVHGDVTEIENAIGTVKARNVGSISTQSGDVVCNDVSGSVSTMSGDVECKSVGGSVNTMSGDICHK